MRVAGQPHPLVVRGILALAILVFFAQVWQLFFLQDDAFIFLRYAENLSAGHGPVWNLGDPVEGYTSPTWLIVLTALHWLPGQVELLVQVVTIGLGLGCLALIFVLVRAQAGSDLAGCLAVTLLAVNRNFALWSTSGMDTRLFAFSALLVGTLLWRWMQGRRRVSNGAWLGVAMLWLSLTRPEGLLFSGLAIVVALASAWPERALRAWCTSVAIWGGGVLIHLLWRLSYYGYPLPNTFYAKVDGTDTGSGSAYLMDFAMSYPFFTVAWLASFLYLVARTRRLDFLHYAAAVTLAHLVYLWLVGGDFMEFRMLDVLLPYATLAIACALCAFAKHSGPKGLPLAVAAGLLLTGANFWQSQRFDHRTHVVLTRATMWEKSTRTWVVVGKWFREIAAPHESLATGGAGAIPYYAGIRAVDMLGLNDATISRIPAQVDKRVGHRRVAPWEYLVEKQITYVIDFPRISLRADPAKLKPDEFFVRVENSEPEVMEGQNFYLVLRTTGSRDELVRSLRKRGVQVVEASTARLPGEGDG